MVRLSIVTGPLRSEKDLQLSTLPQKSSSSSIVSESAVMSPGHMLMTNEQIFDKLASNMVPYSLAPTWMNLTQLTAGAVVGSFKHKDF